MERAIRRATFKSAIAASSRRNDAQVFARGGAVFQTIGWNRIGVL
jgi:hypothetical protein